MNVEVLDNRVTVLEREHKGLTKKLDGHIESDLKGKDKLNQTIQDILISQAELKQSFKIYGAVMIATISLIQIVSQYILR